jgi:hypothetical protein
MSLNISSNRLDSLDAPSVRWLKHTTAVTDLSGNPWKCECSALGEAWRELRHRLTLECASPEDRRGRTWDVLEGDLCPDTISSMDIPENVTLNVSTASPNITTDPGHAFSITLIVVIVIVVGCVLVGGGFIAVKVIKKLRKRSELPEYYKVRVDHTETISLVSTS